MSRPPAGGRPWTTWSLELEDLAMHFGPVRAVDGVSLQLRRGQVHGPGRRERLGQVHRRAAA